MQGAQVNAVNRWGQSSLSFAWNSRNPACGNQVREIKKWPIGNENSIHQSLVDAGAISTNKCYCENSENGKNKAPRHDKQAKSKKSKSSYYDRASSQEHSCSTDAQCGKTE